MIDKLALLEERGWRCEFCGTEISNDYEVHHCLFHRMKGRPELDEKYNLMIVCKKCHPKANANWVRNLFWTKQALRYGIVALVNWYNRARVADKPLFSEGSKGYSLHINGDLQICWNLGEVALIGENMKRPIKPNDLIKSIQKISIMPVDDPVPEGVQGAIIGIIEGLLGSKQRRQALLYRLFPGKWPEIKDVSTKDLLPGQWKALYRWIEPKRYKAPDGKTPWYGSADFVTECTLVMAGIPKGLQEGQEHLDPGRETETLKYFQEKYGLIPVMMCGCEADGLTALWNPYCSVHSEGGENIEAYTIQADQTIMELKENAD